MDTIFALATAPGRAGVSVVRVSGPAAFAACAALAGDVPDPRQARLRRLKDAQGVVLDEALILTFESGKSFTGEDVVELHLHGSIAVQRAVLACLSEMPGIRGAEAGEFTRRALDNDRMDLTQVEALSDLIEAETELQRKQALDVMSGALGRRVEDWRARLIRAASLLEATIDFADEEVPVDVTDEVRALLAKLSADFRHELDGVSAAERVRTGFEVAIVGLPNAGKSTLLNHLAGREAAITSDIAGTTRDVIEVRMDIGGMPVTLLDTAGLRDAADPVEQLGVARAIERAESADLRVHLLDDGTPVGVSIKNEDIILRPKQDDAAGGVGVSGKTGAGVAWLLDQLRDTLARRVMNAGLASRERHRAALNHGALALETATTLLDDGPESYDLVSEDLRQAARALERLLGRVDVEDVLDRIFANFCIGK